MVLPLLLLLVSCAVVLGGPLFVADVPLPGGASASVAYYSGDSAYGRAHDVCRCHKVPTDECVGPVVAFLEAQLPAALERGEIVHAQIVNLDRRGGAPGGELTGHLLTMHAAETALQAGGRFCEANGVGRCEAVVEALVPYEGVSSRWGEVLLETGVYVDEGSCLAGAPISLHQGEDPEVAAATACALHQVHEGCEPLLNMLKQSAASHQQVVASGFGLGWLLGASTNSEHFLERHWQQQPLLQSRPLQRTRFAELVDTLDLLTMVRAAERDNSSQSILVVNTSFAQSLGGFDSVAAAYLAGYSLVVHTAEVSWKPIALLCRSLWPHMLYPSVNAYLSPVDGHAFPPHTDAQDVFILQIAGKKHWRVYQPPVLLPYKDEMRGKPNTSALSYEELGAPLLDVLLEPGDLLYMPRGYPHEAWPPKGEMSLHLTLTVPTHAYSMGKIVEAAIEDVLSENVDFRDAIPVQDVMWPQTRTTEAEPLFESRLAELVSRVSLQSSLSKFLARFNWFVDKSNHLLAPNVTQEDDALWDILAAPRLQPDTMLRRAADEATWQACVEANAKIGVMANIQAQVAAVAALGEQFHLGQLEGLDTFGQISAAAELLRTGCADRV